MNYSRRRSLYANEGTLIEYEMGSGLLWWDSVCIGKLIDSPFAVESVASAVRRLHQADVQASVDRQARLRQGQSP